jgi:hypothetical protein
MVGPLEEKQHKTTISYIVFRLTRPGIESTIYHSWVSMLSIRERQFNLKGGVMVFF